MSLRTIIPKGIPRGVWGLCATCALVSTGFGMAVPLIPVYGSRLGASALQIGLLMSGFFAGRLIAEIPAGLTADRMGRRPVVAAALAGYVATCFGYAASGTTEILIALRVLQGLSSGFFGVAARSLVSDMCKPEVRGAGQGLFSASYNLGFVAGPIVGAVAALQYDITTPFLAAGVMCAIAFAGLLWASGGKGRTAPDAAVDGEIPRSPIDGKILLLACANMTFWAGMSVVMTLFPIAGESRIEGGLALVGSALTAAGLCGLLIGPVAGRVSDRIGRPPVMALGALLSAAEGTAIVSTDNPIVIAACFGVGGIGAAAFTSGLYAVLGDMTSWKGRGTVTGIVGAAGVLGGMIGAMVATLTWEASDLLAPFVLHAAFAVPSALLAVLLWRITPPPTPHKPVVTEPIIQG